MKVPFIDLSRQHDPLRKELVQAFERVLDKSNFILGDEVKEFEKEVSSYVGTKYAIGVSNGTNALLLSLKVLGVGPDDEVITTPFTFIATAEVIAILGAKPVFCDIESESYNINPDKIGEIINDKTKAIIPVHLFGQLAEMTKISDIAKNNGIGVVEDMAQAIGAKYEGRMAGSFGDTACISFFPTKNLNALGDAGMILTSDGEVDKMLRALRVHGAVRKYQHDFLGYNDRLDAIQAAFLRIKLKYLDEWNEKRRQIAHAYDNGLRDVVRTPNIRSHNESIYHQYTIRTSRRDELRKHLTEKGIGTAINYPIPLHLQKTFEYLGHKQGDFPEAEKAAKEVLSLPIHHTLTDEETGYVVTTINEFLS